MARIFCELVRSSALLTTARSARLAQWLGAAAAAAVGRASAPF